MYQEQQSGKLWTVPADISSLCTSANYTDIQPHSDSKNCKSKRSLHEKGSQINLQGQEFIHLQMSIHTLRLSQDMKIPLSFLEKTFSVTTNY